MGSHGASERGCMWANRRKMCGGKSGKSFRPIFPQDFKRPPNRFPPKTGLRKNSPNFFFGASRPKRILLWEFDPIPNPLSVCFVLSFVMQIYCHRRRPFTKSVTRKTYRGAKPLGIRD